MAELIVILVVLGIVLIVVAGVLSSRREKRKNQAIQAWAAANRWYFSGPAQVPWRDRVNYRNFQVRRLLNGDIDGMRASVSDCTYETQHSSTNADGHHTTTTTVHHLVISTAQLNGFWPDMALTQRGLGSKMMRALGKRSPVESGHDEFDRRFRVDAADPGAAREYLSPALVQALTQGEVPPWSLRAGELLVVWHGAMRPEDLDFHVWTLRRTAELLGRRL